MFQTFGLATVVSSAICMAAKKKKGLTNDGVIAAFPIGVICVMAGVRFIAVLLVFFVFQFYCNTHWKTK